MRRMRTASDKAMSKRDIRVAELTARYHADILEAYGGNKDGALTRMHHEISRAALKHGLDISKLVNDMASMIRVEGDGAKKK